MKKITSFILLFVFITSCYAQNEKLELKLEKGKTYTQEFHARMNSTQEMMGQEMNIATDATYNISYKVIDVQDDIYNLETKYVNGMVIKMDSPFGNINSNENEELVSMTKKMMDKPFYLKISKTGKVKEVTGFDEVIAGFAAASPGISDMTKQQIVGMIKQLCSKDAFQTAIADYPQTAIKVGDKWNTLIKLPAPINSETENAYELKAIDADSFTIIGKSIINISDFEMNIENISATMNMTGQVLTDIKADKKTGWIKKSTTLQNLEGSISVSGMTIPMSIESTITVTGKY